MSDLYVETANKIPPINVHAMPSITLPRYFASTRNQSLIVSITICQESIGSDRPMMYCPKTIKIMAVKKRRYCLSGFELKRLRSFIPEASINSPIFFWILRVLLFRFLSIWPSLPGSFLLENKPRRVVWNFNTIRSSHLSNLIIPLWLFW